MVGDNVFFFKGGDFFFSWLFAFFWFDGFDGFIVDVEGLEDDDFFAGEAGSVDGKFDGFCAGVTGGDEGVGNLGDAACSHTFTSGFADEIAMESVRSASDKATIFYFIRDDGFDVVHEFFVTVRLVDSSGVDFWVGDSDGLVSVFEVFMLSDKFFVPFLDRKSVV